MRAAAAAGALLAVLLAAARARAEPKVPAYIRNMHGSGGARFGFAYTGVVDPERAGRLAHAGAFTVGARGALGRRLAWGPAFELALGGAYRGAFLYEFSLLPVGLAVRLGRVGVLGLCAGGGFSGAYDRVPFSWQLPAELWLEQDLGGRVRVALAARAAWLTRAARQDGSHLDVLAVDEVTAGLALRFGSRHELQGSLVGSGYEVGLGYREQLGTRVITVSFGFHLSGATR